jgi:hypothetical protein
MGNGEHRAGKCLKPPRVRWQGQIAAGEITGQYGYRCHFDVGPMPLMSKLLIEVRTSDRKRSLSQTASLKL